MPKENCFDTRQKKIDATKPRPKQKEPAKSEGTARTARENYTRCCKGTATGRAKSSADPYCNENTPLFPGPFRNTGERRWPRTGAEARAFNARATICRLFPPNRTGVKSQVGDRTEKTISSLFSKNSPADGVFSLQCNLLFFDDVSKLLRLRIPNIIVFFYSDRIQERHTEFSVFH